MEPSQPKIRSAWRAGWEATKQAHHGITFYWGIDMILGGVGGVGGKLLVPKTASSLQQALYPTVGTILGVIVGVLTLFIFFIVVSYIQKRFTVMVTNVVNQVSVHNNVTLTAPYPTPIVLADVDRGVSTLQYLLKRGAELEPDLSPTGEHRFGWPQLEYWTQSWLDNVSIDVWQYIPQQAAYIMNDEGLQIRNELMKYDGWKYPLATRRVVFSHRFGRLREICSQIPELHRVDSQTEGDE